MATNIAPEAAAIKSQFFHHTLNHDPKKVVKAEGSILTLEDGTKVFDASSGAAVAGIGHGNEEVAKAMIEQMKEVSYVLTYLFTSTGTEELAHELIEGTEGKMSKALILGSGKLSISYDLIVAG